MKVEYAGIHAKYSVLEKELTVSSEHIQQLQHQLQDAKRKRSESSTSDSSSDSSTDKGTSDSKETKKQKQTKKQVTELSRKNKELEEEQKTSHDEIHRLRHEIENLTNRLTESEDSNAHKYNELKINFEHTVLHKNELEKTWDFGSKFKYSLRVAVDYKYF